MNVYIILPLLVILPFVYGLQNKCGALFILLIKTIIFSRLITDIYLRQKD
jgi:hypothetical protein